MWPGEPASATPPIAIEWLRDWWEFRDNSAVAGWDKVRDWRRAASFEWRKKHRTWSARKKTGAGVSAKFESERVPVAQPKINGL